VFLLVQYITSTSHTYSYIYLLPLYVQIGSVDLLSYVYHASAISGVEHRQFFLGKQASNLGPNLDIFYDTNHPSDSSLPPLSLKRSAVLLSQAQEGPTDLLYVLGRKGHDRCEHKEVFKVSRFFIIFVL